jgi:membrane protease YdiL (CAAX protease family)
MNKTTFIQRHPLLTFYVLAFAISWLGWMPQTLHSYGLFPFDHPILNLLGGAGPTLAAVAVLWATGNRDGIRRLFSSLLRWRFALIWYVFVFLFWFVVATAAITIGILFGQPLPTLKLISWFALPSVFLMMLISNVWAEVGWRGFALPRLQEHHSDLKIVFIMGLLWSIWHLPLLLNPASPMASLPWYGEILFSLSLTAIYTWLYNHTRHSLLPVSIFHAMSNTVAFILLELGVYGSSYLFVVGITTTVAVGIVLLFGTHRFHRSGNDVLLTDLQNPEDFRNQPTRS